MPEAEVQGPRATWARLSAASVPSLQEATLLLRPHLVCPRPWDGPSVSAWANILFLGGRQTEQLRPIPMGVF